MTKLSQSVGSAIEDNTIHVDAPVANPAIIYSLGNEIVRVMQASGTTWSVRRGWAGTKRTTHGSNTVLTALYPTPEPVLSGGSLTVTGSQGGSVEGATEIKMAGVVSDLGSGVAGQGLVLQLIGPFTIAFDAPGLQTDGALVTALDANTVVIQVAVFVTTPFNGGCDQFSVNLGGSAYAAPNDDYALVTAVFPPSNPQAIGTGFRISNVQAFQDGDNATQRMNISTALGLLSSAGALVAYAPHGTPSAGSADIYAIIATPAS